MKCVRVALSLFAGAALGALISASAQAADWSEPVSDWTGFYVGAHVGAGWANWSGDLTDHGSPNPAHWPGGDTSAAINGSGLLGGVQLGYNHQQDSVVWGLEGDIAASSVSGFGIFTTVNFGAGNPVGAAQQVFDKDIRTNLDWLGTVRGRLGVLIQPATLLYATGGLAVGGTSSHQDVYFDGGNATFPRQLHASGAAGATLWGWTAGGGVEHKLDSHWSVKAEYLFANLGKVDYHYIGTHTGYPYGSSGVHDTDGFSANLIVQAVRVGLNYKFGGP